MRRYVVWVVLGMILFLPVWASAAEKTTLEVAVFEGGYGLDWVKELGAGYEKANPSVKVNVWGNPRVWEQLRPRYIEGNPPDVTQPGWGFATWPTMTQGQFLALDDALNAKSYDGKKAWKDTMDQLTSFMYKGKTYGIPYFTDAFGWWYSQSLFEKKGWSVPKTWDELWDLSKKIKASGMAPFATCGLTPDYIIYWRWGFFEYYLERSAGLKGLEDALNMVPGAWKKEGVLKAAEVAQKVNKEGWFLEGTLGLSHTDSQVMFFTGKAAMIPVGTWLEKESQDVIPPDFKLRFMMPPAVPGGKGDPTAIHLQTNTSASWFVSQATKNPKISIDFLKFATTVDSARQSTRLAGSGTTVKGAWDAVTSDAVKSAFAFLDKSKTIFNSRVWETRYPVMDKEYNVALYDLVTLKKTPQQFGDYMESVAQKIRTDKDTVMLPIKLAK